LVTRIALAPSHARRNTDGDSNSGIDQSQDRLSPSVVRAQCRDDHHDRNRNSGRDGIVRTVHRCYDDCADPD